MAIRDILVLNTTASRAETQQGSDTVVIKGNSGEALSVENSSGTSILSVNTVSSSVNVAGKITATTDVSSSLGSSGSFGRLEATTLIGSAFNLTNTAIPGTISSSGQIANQISGSFRRGFEFTGTIGDTIPDQQNKVTASFGRIVAISFSGSAAGLTNTDLDNTISSSAQIASQISGAFTSGFEFDGIISGSAASTGSFGRVEAIRLIGDVRNMTNILKAGIVTGSGQLAVSGAFNAGFEYEGIVSGSSKSTGSFNSTIADKAIGNISAMTNIVPSNTISSSAQISSNISGSFNKGFEFDGTIKNNPLSFSAGGAMINGSPSYFYHRGGAGNKNAGIFFGGYRNPGATTATTEEYNGTSFSEVNDLNNNGAGGGSGTSEAALMTGGIGRNCDTEEYNGTNWSQVNDMNIDTWCYSPIVFGASSEAAVASSGGDSPYTQTETWNGTNWSTANQMINDARFWIGGTGTSNAGLTVGGPWSPSTPQTSKTELWNGTNWSAGPDATYDNMKLTGLAGNQNDAITGGFLQRTNFDGNLFSNPVGNGECSIRYDGSSWSAAGNFGIDGAIAFTGIGQSVGVAMFGAGLSPASPHFYHAPFNTVEVTEGGPTTGSFGYVYAESYKGDGSGLTNTSKTGTVSGSGGIASRISGSFQSGFVFNGSLSGSVSSTGSFAHVTANTLTGNISNLSNISLPANSLSSSAQLAGVVSASFEQGEYTFEGNLKPTLGAWSSVNGLNTARSSTMGFGNNNAAIAAGGCTANGDYNAWTEKTEQWNGTNWTEVNDMIRHGSRNGRGAGTQDAGLVFGGFQSGYCTEEWNGTIWDTVASMNVERDGLNGYGTQNAAMAVSGFYPNINGRKDSVETYDGFSWTNTQTMLYTRYGFTGAGSVNASIVSVGRTTFAHGPYGRACNKTELWDGTTWTEVGPNNTSGEFKLGAGTVNAYTMFSGDEGIYTFTSPYTYSDFVTPNSNDKRDYDGITFSEQARLINSMSGRGFNSPNSQTSVMAIGGSTPAGMVNSTEIYTHCQASASFGRIETPKTQITNDSRVVAKESFQLPIFGTNPVTSSAGEVWYNRAEEKLYFTYDINSWSEVADTITSHNFGGYAGSVYQGIVWGGANPNTEDKSEVWNGVSWTEVNDLNTARTYSPGGGDSNAAIAAGGSNPGPTSVTEIWDGTSWTEVNDGALGYGASFAGTVNAAVTTGGRNGSAGAEATTKEWNGANWSTGGSLILARASFAGMLGTQNAAKHMGGTANTFPQQCDDVEDYNGTSFSTAASLSVATKYTSAAGTQNAGVFAGGASDNSANTSATYEWNGTSFHQTANLGTGRCTGDIADGSQSSFQVSSGGSYGGSEKKTEQYTTTSVKSMCIGGV